LIIGRIKCKQSTSVYAHDALINNLERAGVHSLTLYTHSIDSKAISLSTISKITVDLNRSDVDKLILCTT